MSRSSLLHRGHALQEASVVAMADGAAHATRRPAALVKEVKHDP